MKEKNLNIRKTIAQDITKTLKDFLDENLPGSYDDSYVGKVVDNKDPEKIGRCKIRVYGVFGDEVPDRDLPWATPDFTFVGSKKGSFIVPPKDTIVKVYFDNGELYLPKYSTKIVDKSNLPGERLTDYPNNMVFFETDEGDFFTINRKTGFVKFYHGRSKSFVTIDKLGNMIIDVEGSPIGTITINAKTKVEVNSPLVTIPHTALGSVIPDPTGGPFNCLLLDPVTGAVHQGTDNINQ